MVGCAWLHPRVIDGKSGRQNWCEGHRGFPVMPTISAEKRHLSVTSTIGTDTQHPTTHAGIICRRC